MPGAFESNLASAGAANTSMQLHLLAWLQAPRGDARPNVFDNNLAFVGAANTYVLEKQISIATVVFDRFGLLATMAMQNEYLVQL